MLTFHELDAIHWDTTLIGKKVDMCSLHEPVRLAAGLCITTLFGVGVNADCLLEMNSISGIISDIAIKGEWL